MYLGGFAHEDEAAHAYDLAALGCKGDGVPTNFLAASYAHELKTLDGCCNVSSCKAVMPEAYVWALQATLVLFGECRAPGGEVGHLRKLRHMNRIE